MPLLRLGTRGSPLALAQAEETARRLSDAFPELAGEVEIVVIKTSGDRIQDRPLAEIGGKGLFTKEIEEALLDGRIDCAVHSLKDMPAELPPGLVLAATPEREDPRDAFISHVAERLEDLPKGARLGTASLRRQAQALHVRPDLEIVVRVHSESLFNRFPLRTVENRDKMKMSVKHIVSYGVGAMLLLYNDGRGAGFGAYATDRMMSESGQVLSSDEAYRKLGVGYDSRDYDASMLLLRHHIPNEKIQMIMNSPASSVACCSSRSRSPSLITVVALAISWSTFGLL